MSYDEYDYKQGRAYKVNGPEIRFFLREMKKLGWKPVHVDHLENEVEKVNTEAEAMENIFAVDECKMKLQNKAGKGCVVYIVLGNDAGEAIADHTINDDIETVTRMISDKFF